MYAVIAVLCTSFVINVYTITWYVHLSFKNMYGIAINYIHKENQAFENVAYLNMAFMLAVYLKI